MTTMSPGRSCRHQDLFDIGEESCTVHGAIKDHGCCHALQPECADEGGGFPMAMRHRRPAAFAAQSAPIPPGHFGRRARFINEHQPLRLEINLEIEPGLPPAQDVRPLLFGGVRCFFYKSCHDGRADARSCLAPPSGHGFCRDGQAHCARREHLPAQRFRDDEFKLFRAELLTVVRGCDPSRSYRPHSQGAAPQPGSSSDR